jgi:enoyl-CoA hydratase
VTHVSYQNLIVERHPDGFATVMLNRPDKLNTLSIALRQELERAVRELQADPQTRVLILTGAGRAFTAGLDLDEWDTPGMSAAGAWEHNPVAALRLFSGPVIGAINGLTITGGVEIALSCDVLIAASTARFADTHVKVGLLPGWGGSVRMGRRIGLNRAKELALTGRFFSADEALQWGFVNEVVPPDSLQARAQELARQMLANVPEGLVAYKRLLDEESELPMAQALVLESDTARAMNFGVTREEIDARLARLRRQGR